MLIPPWQQPDEPTHLARAELQRNRLAVRAIGRHPAREDEILRSMANHDFWVHRGRGVPTVLPRDFEEAGQFVAVATLTVNDPPAYSFVAGRVLSWVPPRTVVEDLYVVRALSAGLAMLTLLVAWLAASRILAPPGAAMTALLLALHPQFAVVSVGATPDAMVNLLGAFVWWQAVCAVTGGRELRALTVMWTAAVAAAAADRMGLPLVVLALLATVIAVARHVGLRGRWTRSAALGAAVLVGAALAAVASAVYFFGSSYALGRIFGGGLAPVPGAMTPSRFVRFSWLLHQSWWFSLGWARYAPPLWWSVAAAVLAAAAVAGVGRRLVGDATILDRRTSTVLAIGAAGVAIQLAAVYWAFFRLGNGGQGKYLFPVLVPALMLLWAGIEAWVPPARRLHAAAALILLFALLDAAAWTLVAIPVFYASL